MLFETEFRDCIVSTVVHEFDLFHQPTLMHNFLYSLTICLCKFYDKANVFIVALSKSIRNHLIRALLLQHCLNNTVELILI